MLPVSAVRPGPPALRVENLNHWYGEEIETRKQVLFDNHLEVAQGEIVIMTGPSGLGKDDAADAARRLRTVQDGNIEILGRRFSGLSGKQLVEVRRDIGFIFQAHNLFASLTALRTCRWPWN